MPLLLGHLHISPDDIHSREDAQKVVGSLPARVTVVGDVQHYPEGVLEFLLVHAVRPMIAAGATFDRAMFLVHPKTPFPAHLLEGPVCPYQSEAGKPHQVLASRAWPSTPDPELRSLDEPIVRWPVTAVLLSGGKGDYSAYVGMGSPGWVAKHGAKLSFDEASGLFPGVTSERYGW